MADAPIVPAPAQVAPYVENTFTDGVWHFKVRTYTSPNPIPGLVNVTVKLSVGGKLFPPGLPGWFINYGVDILPPVSVGGMGRVSVPIMAGQVGFTLTVRASPDSDKTGVYLWLHTGPGNLSIKLLPATIPPEVKGWLSWGTSHGGGLVADGGIVVRFENVPGKPIEPNAVQNLLPIDGISPGLPSEMTMLD